MKILPLALVLIATSAFAQVSTPVLRKGPASERPKAWAPSGTPASARAATQPDAPATAPAKVSATGRPGRPVFKPKQEPKNGEVEAASAAAASEPKPKKGGGFFGFFGKLFGGGKKKAAASDATAGAAGAAAKPETPTVTTRSSAVAAKPGVVADPGSTIRPNMKGAKKGTNNAIVPAMAASRETSADRSATIPVAVQNAKPDAANASAITPSLKKPAAGSTGPSSISPVMKPAAKSDAPEPSSITPPIPSKAASSTASTATKEASALPGGAAEPAKEFDKARYAKVRREAAADPTIAQLGEKLNATPPGAAYTKAARNYASSLFAKMREIDPSQEEWINRMEGATLRRINAGKAFVAE